MPEEATQRLIHSVIFLASNQNELMKKLSYSLMLPI